LKKGFSLPVWVTASAKSAVKKLLCHKFEDYEYIKIPDKKSPIKVKIHSTGLLNDKSQALAITFVDSGLDLDLTQNLEIWTIASLIKLNKSNNSSYKSIDIIPGEGVGVHYKTAKICISNFALTMLEINLLNLIPNGFQLRLQIILPKGEFLAERTSNKAFGIVDGLSIIGTTAETHISSSPEQLDSTKAYLDEVVLNNPNNNVVFVIGENGLDLVRSLNLPFPVIKVGNWIGPLLLYAATKNLKKILIIGYHGKLIKLAGGIFNTHNHLADARIEILVYQAIKQKTPLCIIDKFSESKTVEEALHIIEMYDLPFANNLWNAIANQIELRSLEYLKRYLDSDLIIGTALFDKSRKIRWIGSNGRCMLSDISSLKS